MAMWLGQSSSQGITLLGRSGRCTGNQHLSFLTGGSGSVHVHRCDVSCVAEAWDGCASGRTMWHSILHAGKLILAIICLFELVSTCATRPSLCDPLVVDIMCHT